MNAPSKRGKARHPAAPRNPPDCQQELSTIDQAHIQNEAGRDTFLALAHTALFAASIAFVGNLAGATPPKFLMLLILAWFASVVGLLSLTVSFHSAARHINRRRQQIFEDAVDEPRLTIFLNHIALWSFPAALISTFAFATINMLAR